MASIQEALVSHCRLSRNSVIAIGLDTRFGHNPVGRALERPTVPPECQDRRSDPFFFEYFRIDVPPTGPVAVGTISRSINARDRVEGIPDDTSGFAIKRDATQAVARIGTLSERERQVLLALAAGHPHKLIAHDLGISVRTIEVHRSRMMRRLGVRTSAEAITLAVIAGTVE